MGIDRSVITDIQGICMVPHRLYTRPGPRTRRWREICHICRLILLSLVIEGDISLKGPPHIRYYCLKSCPVLVTKHERASRFQYCVIFTSFTHPIYFLASPYFLAHSLLNRVVALKLQHLPTKTIWCYLLVLITSFHELAAEFLIQT